MKEIVGKQQRADTSDMARTQARAIARGVQEPVLVLDQDLRVIFTNRLFHRTFKVAPEQTIGKFIYHLTDGHYDVANLQHLLERVASEDAQIRDLELDLKFPIIGRRVLLFDARPNRSSDKIRLILIKIKDITERRMAEEALRDSEQKFRSLAEESPNMIFIAKKGRILYANEKCERITGYKRDELYSHGFDLFSLVPPESRASVEGSFSKLMNGKKMPSLECTLLTQDGRRLEVMITTKAIKYESQNAVLGIVTDISERKRVEQVLKKAKEDLERRVRERTVQLETVNQRLCRELAEHAQAEKRLQALSRRLVQIQEIERSHIARELHDEIGQYSSLLHLLLDKAGQSPADKVYDFVSEAKKAAGELAEKVHSMALELRPNMLDLGLLPALEWLFERINKQAGLRVKFEYLGLKDPLPPEVNTAAYRIVQEALTNVLRHAQASTVAVRVKLSRNTLLLQIKDNGVGFDSSALTPGSSAGLSGMHERAALVGGTLRINSGIGAGTTVIAKLPLTKQLIKQTETPVARQYIEASNIRG